MKVLIFAKNNGNVGNLEVGTASTVPTSLVIFLYSSQSYAKKRARLHASISAVSLNGYTNKELINQMVACGILIPTSYEEGALYTSRRSVNLSGFQRIQE